MARRTSVELHPDGCRVVDVHVSGARGSADVVIHAFGSRVCDAADGAGLVDALKALRREHALTRDTWVTIWGLRSTQQLLRLPPAKPDDLEALAIREARKDIAPLETDGEGATVAVLLGGEAQAGQHRRREVALVAVSDADVRLRIQPLADAGFAVTGVTTPALALAALARQRHDAVPGATSAYVALGRRATCLAIVRDGVPLFAREMPWGHDNDTPDEALVARLAAELKRSVLYFKQTFRSAVDAIVLCGDLTNLRTLTAPLSTALAMTVETLDSLVGIDAAALPAPAEQFRAEVATLRMAIAVGADAAPPANLLPVAIRRAGEARGAAVRLVAGAAAGLLLTAGWSYAARSAAELTRAEASALERQVAAIEPDVVRAEELRGLRIVAASRQSALDAFGSQGPRLARVLEAIARATPESVVLRSIHAEATGPAWRLTVSGIAVTSDAAGGQMAVTQLLDELSRSPFAGRPEQAPLLRVVSGSGAASQRDIVPEGLSGVEFTVRFLIGK